MKALSFLTLVLLLSTCCDAARILALLNVVSHSHHIFNRALTRALANKGHQVLVISPDKDKDVIPNLKYIQIEGIYEATKENFDYESMVETSDIAMVSFLFEWISFVCEKQFESAGTKELLNYPSTEKFDLIITESGFSECFYGFIGKFGSPPVVGISPFGIPQWMSISMGTPENPSFVPNMILPYTDHMTFTERAYNAILTFYTMYMYEYSHIPNMEALAKKHFKEELPSFNAIRSNFSILLANVANGLQAPRPISPNIIPIGGMHIKAKPDPLPKDLQTFLDGAKDGFIFFSLGSNLKSDALPDSKRKALLEAFAELPVRVLWKFESENLPGLPPNVKIGKWLPQSDILGHPNIKMFMSHCGKMSSSEAVYRGVPIVGIPFFADQVLNLRQLKTKGVAVELDFMTLTKERVLNAVRSVLNNDSYQRNMKKLSAVFKDYPESALDRAVFWTEYVIRHGGAPHLRPASTSLWWYQYLLLDVLLVFTVGVFSVLCVTCFVGRKLYRTVKGDTKSKLKKS